MIEGYGLLKRIGLVSAVVVGSGFGVAEAGEPTTLASFYGQRLDWHGCQTDPDDEEGQRLDEAGAQCADVTVPLDYARPGGRTITIAISRLRATDTARPLGPLMINLGGPAIPVLARIVDARAVMGDTGARYDLIGMDPRFAGRSTPADCEWPSTWIPRSAGATRQSFDRMVALAEDLAARCARKYGYRLHFASAGDIAHDMDVIRGALGAPKLSYLGYSYGSYFGAAYTQMFPRKAGRIVLDSAIDPADAGVHVRGENASARQKALRDWAGWAAQRDDQFHLGTTADQVLSVVDKAYRTAANRPFRIGQFTVDDTVLPALLIDPLSDDNADNQTALARLVQVLARAAADGSAPSVPELDAALAGILTGAGSAFHSGQTAILCADQAVPGDPEWYWRAIQKARAKSPLFGPVGHIVSPCAFWSAGPARPVHIANGVPALIVNADGDINATPDLSQAMHRALTGSRLVTLTGVRTHGVYLFAGAPCIDETVNAYLNTGTLPDRDRVCTR